MDKGSIVGLILLGLAAVYTSIALTGLHEHLMHRRKVGYDLLVLSGMLLLGGGIFLLIGFTGWFMYFESITY